jgi:asparagine synthase (glutamine-hydrolysing)
MPKTFAIGMDPNQHDLVNARAVAEFLGTEHHEILFNFDEAVSIIREVIWHAETYDLAEVRTTMV